MCVVMVLAPFSNLRFICTLLTLLLTMVCTKKQSLQHTIVYVYRLWRFVIFASPGDAFTVHGSRKAMSSLINEDIIIGYTIVKKGKSRHHWPQKKIGRINTRGL